MSSAWDSNNLPVCTEKLNNRPATMLAVSQENGNENGNAMQVVGCRRRQSSGDSSESATRLQSTNTNVDRPPECWKSK
jgi:hypothetical protein